MTDRSSAPETDFRQDQVDLIQPTKISHHVDEIILNGELEQCYNYIVYKFEQDGVFASAKSYTDEMHQVHFYGPFAEDEQKTKIESPEFEEAIMLYLKRRYGLVKINRRTRTVRNDDHPPVPGAQKLE